MIKLSHTQFLKTLPELVIARLPEPLQGIKVHQPYRWLTQFNYGEQRLHYEVSSAKYHKGWELGFHCEARDRNLNRYLLMGFRRHLFEIKDTLGPTIEAEMWDKGWTKIYEVFSGRGIEYYLPKGRRSSHGRIHNLLTPNIR